MPCGSLVLLELMIHKRSSELCVVMLMKCFVYEEERRKQISNSHSLCVPMTPTATPM